MALIIVLSLVVLLVLAVSYRNRTTSAVSGLNFEQLRSASDTQLWAEDEFNVRAVAFFSQQPDISIERIADFLRQRWALTVSVAQETENVPGRRSLSLAGSDLSFEIVQPMTEDGRLQPVFADNPVWQSARQQLHGHAAAMILTANSDISLLARSVVLSQGLLALTKTCPQLVGSYWKPSNQIISRKQILGEMDEDYVDLLPVGLWVSSRAHTSADGSTKGYTQGLSALGAVDFEALDAPESAGVLRRRLEALAEYSVLSCRTIFNGDTTGVDGCERIRLQKAPSETVNKGWVFQLHYLRQSPRQPWS